MGQQNHLANALAIYAASVATISLVWNIVISRRDVGRISVTASLAIKREDSIRYHYLSSPIATDLKGQMCTLQVKATNIGRRPITLASWAVLSSNTSKPAVGLLTLPTLAESESWDVNIENLDDFRSSSTSFFVTDTHGRNWPLPQEQILNLRDAMLRFKL